MSETTGFQQTCWSLEVEPTDLSSSSKKKKKKKKKTTTTTDKSFGRDKDGFPDILVPKAKLLTYTKFNHVLPPCQDSGVDYEYRELLSRALSMLRENNLEVPEEKRRRVVMMPPQVLAEGIHNNTVCVNFSDLCRMMNRKPDHVMSVLLAEIGTGGSLDKQQRLVMKASVSPKDFKAMFRRYIDTYVVCSCCRSPDTALAEENRRSVLRCEMIPGCSSAVWLSSTHKEQLKN
ncbi:PREDICTED: eukaryotic translation initiation factor 2 subunit beta isoform X3 [Tarenaya hassleriana]|uniref:eukaryotic translation initiation factor 2 subunit beta isoform X3 n=1 Tax=Tarenaya hassleriana TaxID=28532 RepID=UPI00053C5435|nr:PREDICTED: eukaryotic translation initiation factor 2 subunit beta isoform X3 [Tarenaya hassleriana]